MSGKMYVSRGGGIGKELAFTTGAQYDGYHFRCVVTDREGGSETSKSAVLTVMGETRLIRRHPASVIALIGDTVTYTVEASGDGLTYQWEFLRSENDAWAISGMSGNKTETITLEATSVRNGYQYRCVVTDGNGDSEISEAATLTVVSEAGLIARQPANAATPEGETARFSVETNGDGLSYQWQMCAPDSEEWVDCDFGGGTAKVQRLYLVDSDGLTQKVQRAYMVDTDGLTKLVYRHSISITDAVVTLGTSLIYNASSQTQTVASVVVDGVTLVAGTDYVVSGNTETNAGNYTLTITGIGDYEGSISSSWSIAKLNLTKPTVSGSYTYNGNTRAATVSNMDTTYITQSGTASTATAGTYTLTFSLKDTANTQWADGTINNVTGSWSIAKLSLAKPTVSGSFTYDESTKTCTISNMNSTYITQSGTTSATNAGTYTVTFTLKSTTNTCWEDGTTAAISRTWTIGKATGSISVSPASLSIVGGVGSTASATITYIGDGEISVASSATDIVTVERTDATIVCTSVSTGSAIVTITMAEGANYTGASCMIEVQSRIVSFSPEKYTGTVKEMGLVTVDGEEHYLYRLTTNGVLTLDGEVQCWLCGGGARGGYGYVNPDAGPITSGYGGGGGYFTQGNLPQGSYLIVIGEGAKTADSEVLDETITSIINNDNKEQIYYANGGDGANGGSGGGGSVGYWDSEIDYTFNDYWDTNPIFFSVGKGVNTSTYPFNIKSIPGMEDDWGPHCAGGAGGRLLDFSGRSTKYGEGSNGGSDGSDGYMPAIAGGWAQGGNKGGGRVGSSATFYGGGGGGETARPNHSYGDNGYGYQGVVYILD